MRTCVVISANAEWTALKPLFPRVQVRAYPYGECFDTDLAEFPVTFWHAGWGKTASAGALQYLLDHAHPDLVVNLGTCGGFPGAAKQGDLILVERTFIYDIIELMEPGDVTDYYASSLDLSWLVDPVPFPALRGLVASADADLLPEKISLLRAKGALAADWESASLAWVAQKNQARLLILRMVSDVVSADGGEMYGDLDAYKDRTRASMRQLVEQLPAWLRAVRL
jgi:adenosylhomocysteine nucleosidase